MLQPAHGLLHVFTPQPGLGPVSLVYPSYSIHPSTTTARNLHSHAHSPAAPPVPLCRCAADRPLTTDSTTNSVREKARSGRSHARLKARCPGTATHVHTEYSSVLKLEHADGVFVMRRKKVNPQGSPSQPYATRAMRHATAARAPENTAPLTPAAALVPSSMIAKLPG